jgi:hypothetical protein
MAQLTLLAQVLELLTGSGLLLLHRLARRARGLGSGAAYGQ